VSAWGVRPTSIDGAEKSIPTICLEKTVLTTDNDGPGNRAREARSAPMSAPVGG